MELISKSFYKITLFTIAIVALSLTTTTFSLPLTLKLFYMNALRPLGSKYIAIDDEYTVGSFIIEIEASVAKDFKLEWVDSIQFIAIKGMPIDRSATSCILSSLYPNLSNSDVINVVLNQGLSNGH